ncbi:hypothetical protein C1H46_022625 [Malus baccata]|uniref:DYW domain-containing protein n=1 Tax=Malus baccata TaxID=106549 RepID=A0A540LZ68_MALBA|nr:hypothetical protein C1H46_022625 [Malus baccata]
MLKEAEELIESMLMIPDVATWGALLGACTKHGDHDRSERIGRKLIELEPDHDGFHVLLSDICASKDGVVHEFLAGDKKHLRIKEIDATLDEIAKRLKKEGYAADTDENWKYYNQEMKNSSRAVGQKDQLGVRETHLNEMIRACF